MNAIDKSSILKLCMRKVLRRWVQSRNAPQARFIASMTELADKAVLRREPRKVTFFGTDDFSVQSLSALHTELIKGQSVGELHVVTSRAKKGRTPVEAFSSAAGLTFQHWPVSAATLPDSDLGVVVSFGHLLPLDIIESFPLGVLNVHGSLLPAYRGGAPIIRAVMNGDSVSGVTVMRIHPHRFDVGEIVRQARVFVPLHATSGTLYKALATLGANLLAKVVMDLPRHYQLASPQPSTGVSNARKVGEKDALVDWQRSTAAHVYCQFLGLDDHFPLWTKWRGTTLLLRGAIWQPGGETHSEVRARDLRVEVLELMQSDSGSVERIQGSDEIKSDDRISENEVHERFVQDSLNFEKSLLSTDMNNNNQNREREVLTAFDKRESVRLKLLNLFRFHVPEHLEPGQITYFKKVNVLWVGCAEGVIGFTDIKPRTKKSMTAHDFFNGFLTKVPHEEWHFDTHLNCL